MAATVTATGVLDSRSASYDFECFGTDSATFTFYNAQPKYSELSFVRLDSVIPETGVAGSASQLARGGTAK